MPLLTERQTEEVVEMQDKGVVPLLIMTSPERKAKVMNIVKSLKSSDRSWSIRRFTERAIDNFMEHIKTVKV